MSVENPFQSPQAPTGPVRPGPERNLAWTLFSFDDRIPRRVYWGASLATLFVFYVIVFGLRMMLGEDSPAVLGVTLLLYIPVLWISLAIQVKRWHDRDKSGWWVLINVVPIIGPIWAFVEVGCLRGTLGPNQYGNDPT
jgi:uncharacterized membrane protein YhaH (DUF805 family)